MCIGLKFQQRILDVPSMYFLHLEHFLFKKNSQIRLSLLRSLQNSLVFCSKSLLYLFFLYYEQSIEAIKFSCFLHSIRSFFLRLSQMLLASSSLAILTTRHIIIDFEILARAEQGQIIAIKIFPYMQYRSTDLNQQYF